MHNFYSRCKSIRAMLQRSYVLIIVLMALPTLILMATTLTMSAKYDKLIENIQRVSELRDLAGIQIKQEIWDIVAGKKTFQQGQQYALVKKLKQELEDLANQPDNADRKQYLVAAERATGTLHTYIDTLHTLIKERKAVVYHEEVYFEIKSVAELTSDVLQQYINEGITAISNLNRSIQGAVMLLTILVAGLLGSVIAFAADSYKTVQREVYFPIHALEKMTSRIAAGDLSARVSQTDIEELRYLTESFNSMAVRVQKLMNQQIEAQKTLKKAELRTLQAQITPHFVYNTFETIVWLAEKGRNREVIEITMAFTNFFRISLSRGQDYITVEKEEQHVRSYLTIQSVRYGNIMTYDIDIDPELKGYFMLKLLLQPLVENAIYHGIKKKRGRGHIQVTGCKDGGFMTFSIADNGIGIKEEQLTLLRSRLRRIRPEGDMGFGLYNVNKRICLFYGGEGLKLDSEYRKGTRISFTLPLSAPEQGGNGNC